jgi:WD40 repeat protein
MYEMRGVNKQQMINAHTGKVTAAAFGPDGKTLATFSAHDNKLYFWQTSTSMFGLGNAQTKCTKSYNVAPYPQANKWSPTYTPKLVWISPRTVTLLLPDGIENRFNC